MPARRPILLLLAALALAGCEERAISLDDPPAEMLEWIEGHGLAISDKDRALIDWSVSLPDGTEVISGEGQWIGVGEGRTIAAVDETLAGMRVGGYARSVVPPHLHWGRQGYGPIPPNTSIVLELRVHAVQPRGSGSLSSALDGADDGSR